MNSRLWLFFLISPLVLWVGTAHALSSDKNQPTRIVADRVDVDDQKGISIFRGNVRLTRGSIRMTADIVTVYRDNKQDLDKVIAKGNPVSYRQTPDGKKEDVVAQARNVEYHAAKDRVILLQNAKVWQGKDTFTGNRIVYDIQRDIVHATKAPTATKGDKGRVEITIQPKKTKD